MTMLAELSKNIGWLAGSIILLVFSLVIRHERRQPVLRSQSGQCANLAQHRQLIDVDPALCDATILDSQNADLRGLHLCSRRRNARKLAEVGAGVDLA